MVNRLLIRSSLRFYLRHRWQTLLILTGIFLGVAVVVAVDLANESARRAFRLSLDTVAESATHHIHGGPAGIPEPVFTALRRELGIHQSAPLMTDYVKVSGHVFTLLGVDPVSEIGMGRYSGDFEGYGDLLRPSAEDSVLLPASAAVALGVGLGDEVVIEYRGRTHKTVVGAILSDGQVARAGGLLMTDIAVAQEIVGRIGTVDRIDLTVDINTAAMIAQWLPESLSLVENEHRNRTLVEMTESFYLNLTAMSLLALLVGGLLIYNTITFSILQRRRYWGIYRALGATHRQILSLIMLETAVLALVGTLVGILAGILLSQGLVHLVLRTVNDLYFVLTVREFALSPLSLAKGMAMGFGVTLLSALVPTLEAAKTRPAAVLQRSRIEGRALTLTPWLFVSGVILMAFGWWLVNREDQGLIAGFTAMALLVFGFCIMVPAIVYVAIRLAMACLPARLGAVPKMALRGINAGISRTGLAIAALTVAVAATAGMAVMVGSFRTSLEAWLDQVLSGDIYVSEPGYTAQRPGPGLPLDWVDTLVDLTGVKAIERYRFVRVETGLGPFHLLAFDTSGATLEQGSGRTPLKESVPEARSRFVGGEGILISVPLANNQNLGLNDSISLTSLDGVVDMNILGIFTDYRSTRGVIAMHRDLYRQLWNDNGVSSLAIYLDGSVPEDIMVQRVREATLALPGITQVQHSSDIRERSLAIFERTFAVTAVLRMLTILVAFVGVLGAMMLLQLERLRELATLRASGMTGRQVMALVLGQTGVMGLLAGLLAIPLGLLMGNVLIDVINLRAFGWTLTREVPVGSLIEALLLALTASLLAGCFPAWHAARVAPARVLREE